MKCKAVRDGLIGTRYVREGEIVDFPKCPKWCVPVKGENTPDTAKSGKQED